MIEVVQEVKQINIEVEYSGISITLQPVLLMDGDGDDCGCDVRGGTL